MSDAPTTLASAIEVPFAPEKVAAMVESDGGSAIDRVASSEWGGLDLERARPHMLRVAASVLTDVQLAVFVRWVGGIGVTAIGRELGLTHQVVSKHLFGNGETSNGAPRGGAVKKMKLRLLDDDAYIDELVCARAERHDPDAMHIVREWWAGLRPSHLTHFVPLTVLLLILSLVDAKRTTTFATLHTKMLPSIVTNAIPVLKLKGYIETDGITIKVKRTPLDPERT